jgi:hypothetical protein
MAIHSQLSQVALKHSSEGSQMSLREPRHYRTQDEKHKQPLDS